MAVATLKKVLVVTLMATMATPVVGVSAATTTGKKISVAQGTKIYDKAVKATNAWLKATAHTTTIRNENSKDLNAPIDSRTVTIDGNGNMLFVEKGLGSYYIVDLLYKINEVSKISDRDLAIARDLGLDVNAKYMVMHPLLLNPSDPIDAYRAVYREVLDPTFTWYFGGAKSTTVTYNKAGTTELLTATLIFPAKKTSPSKKRVITTRIEQGRITASYDTITSAGVRYKTTTTYERFTGSLTAPDGPYFDWDKVFLDPRYGKLTDEENARMKLNGYLSEVLGRTALANLEKPTVTIWKQVAADKESVVVYDKGIEFSYESGTNKRACGVFTDRGAELKLKTCEELGFTRL